jgi:hypothetical protein
MYCHEYKKNDSFAAHRRQRWSWRLRWYFSLLRFRQIHFGRARRKTHWSQKRNDSLFLNGLIVFEPMENVCIPSSLPFTFGSNNCLREVFEIVRVQFKRRFRVLIRKDSFSHFRPPSDVHSRTYISESEHIFISVHKTNKAQRKTLSTTYTLSRRTLDYDWSDTDFIK